MRHDTGKDIFRSLDLSRATDGLFHGAVEAVIDGLASVNAIRPADLAMAKRSLGLEGNGTWYFPDLISPADEIGWDVPFLRGSPMGTPLSFVCLSWVNSWATSCFDKRFTHGDDAVGRSRKASCGGNPTAQLAEYRDRVASVGAELNRGKTFRANHSWTACEVLAHPEGQTSRMVVTIPPTIPPVSLKAPLPAPEGVDKIYLRRMERLMVTRFPWLIQDARTHLPCGLGGLGYTGRGLSVGTALRRRLGALVSREPNEQDARRIHAKTPFREAGLYPRPLARVVPSPVRLKAMRNVASYGLTTVPEGEEPSRVSAVQFAAFENCLVEDEVRLICGEKYSRKRVAGRPARTQGGAAFKKLSGKVALARPLSKSWGLQALARWVDKAKLVKVAVPGDIASEIRDRIPDHETE